MDALDSLYVQLLQFGLVHLHNAKVSEDAEWVEREIEFLHNIPSLINESNHWRHLSFWEAERTYYIEWANASGKEEVQSRIRTFYEPIWNEMQPIIESLDSNSKGMQ